MEAVLKGKLTIDKTDWTLVKFGDVVFEPKENAKDIYNEGIEHVVGLEHIAPGTIHLTKSGILEETTTFSKKFSKGDVLFGRRRAYLKKAAQASFDGICSGDITVFRAKKNILPEMLPFVVYSEKFFDYAVKHSAGGLSPRVKFKDLANYEFLLPPKDQQAQLSELLWAMDDVIEKKTTLNSKLESISLVKKSELLTNCSIDTGNFNCDDIKKEDIFELKDICDVIDPHPSHRAPKEVAEGLPFIGIGDIGEDGTIDLTKVRKISEEDVDKQRQTFNFETYDIGFGRVATIGKVVWLKSKEYKYAISPTMSIVKPKEQNPLFIYEVLKSEYVKNQYNRMVTGSTRRSVGIQKLRTIKIYCPHRKLQDKIASKLLTINNSICAAGDNLRISRALQKSLIDQIF